MTVEIMIDLYIQKVQISVSIYQIYCKFNEKKDVTNHTNHVILHEVIHLTDKT